MPGLSRTMPMASWLEQGFVQDCSVGDGGKEGLTSGVSKLDAMDIRDRR